LDVVRLARSADASGRCTGTLRLAWGVPCRYRLEADPDAGRGSLSVRVGTRDGGPGWEHFTLNRRADGRWAALCPGCGVGRMDLYWLPNVPGGSCWRCHGLRWERQYVKGDADRYRSLYQMGDTRWLLHLVQRGTPMQRLRVRQAGEEEGLYPRQTTLIPRWQRR